MYRMFQAPAFKCRVDQISWAAGDGGGLACESLLAGGGRGCSLTQRGCGQSSWTVGGAERSSASRVAALRHLSPSMTRTCGVYAGQACARSLRIGCVPARPRSKRNFARLPLADAMARARACAGEWLELLWRTLLTVDRLPVWSQSINGERNSAHCCHRGRQSPPGLALAVVNVSSGGLFYL